MKKNIIALSLLILAFPYPATAEQGERGRLSDGRAFRTDSSGIQLVDHVAELELTIESLTRRLEAAENEVKHKDSLLAQQLQAAPVSDDSADLASLSAKLNCPPQPQFVCPEQLAGNVLSNADDFSAKNVDAKIGSEALQEKLAASEKLVLTLKEQKDKDSIWFEQTLAARDQEISLLKVKVEKRENNIIPAQIKGIGSSDGARAGLQMANQRTGLESLNGAQQDVALSNDKEIKEFKKSLKQKLEKTRSLLKDRDDLYSHFSASGNSIQIKPSSGHSSNNRTVDQLSKDLESEQSGRMLSLLSREIADIERQVSEDIELVKRVGKL